MFKIGDFSRISQVPIKTLRYYDEVGLLKPSHVDSLTGYRYYAAEQMPILNRILTLKALGFTLEQIGALLHDSVSSEQIRGMIRLKQAESAERLRLEQERLLQLETWLIRIERENNMPAYDVVLKSVNPVQVLSIRETLPNYPATGRLFQELWIYMQTHQLRLAGPSIALYHDQGYQEQNVDVEAAIPYLGNAPANNRVITYELPGVAQVASVIHQGSYATLTPAYQAIGAWIEAHGYRICGPSREVYLRCMDSENGDPNDCVTEIQFPVEK